MKLNINLILTIIFVLIVANFLCDSFREGALFKPTLSRNNWGHEDLTKKQIEKYFGPLKRGPPKENLSKKLHLKQKTAYILCRRLLSEYLLIQQAF